MRKGATWDEFENERKRSKSAFYKAVQEYLNEKRTEFDTLRENIVASEEKLREVENKHQHLVNVATARENELKDVTNDLEKIFLKLSEKNKELEENQAKLDTTLRELGELKERGVSEPTLQTLNNMDYGSEEELLARIGTMENYLEFSKELEHLRSKVDVVRGEVNQLGDQKSSLEREINNLTLQLESKIKENGSYDAHLSAVNQFVADGYTLGDIGAFLEALKSLRKGNAEPGDLMLLVDSLNKMKQIKELDQVLLNLRAEVNELETKRSAYQGLLSAMKDAYIKELEITRTDTTGELRNLKNALATELTAINERGKEALDETRRTEEYYIKEVTTEALKTWVSSNKQFIEDFHKLIDSTTNSIRQLGDEISIIRKDSQDLGRYESQLAYAKAFYELVENPNVVQEVPLETMARVALRVKQYVQGAFMGVKDSPSPYVTVREGKLGQQEQYDVVAISEFLSDFMEKKARSTDQVTSSN